MQAVAIIQARMSSTRLPGKVLKELSGLSVLGWCVRAAQAVVGIHTVVVATSQEASDDPIAQWCVQANVLCVRGPLHDVLARYALAAEHTKADIIMRLTADCPLLDPVVCGEVLQILQDTVADYACNTMPRVWPDGLDCEVFTRSTLDRTVKEAQLPAEREHVTTFMYSHPELFKVSGLPCPIPNLGPLRWTLDTLEDFAFLAKFVEQLPKDRPPRYTEVLAITR